MPGRLGEPEARASGAVFVYRRKRLEAAGSQNIVSKRDIRTHSGGVIDFGRWQVHSACAGREKPLIRSVLEVST